MKPTLTIPAISWHGLLILVGGGEFSFGETEEVDRFLLEILPPENPRIGFLPTASGSTDYATHLGAYFRDLDPRVEFRNIPVYRGRDVRRGRNLEQIRESGLVYLGGGVTNTLLTTIRATPVEQALHDVIDAGGVVAAIGAAASAFGTIARSMVTVGAPIEGLGWIPESLIETGFRSEEARRFSMLMRSPRVRLGIGIPAGSALAIAPDRQARILGEGKIAVVRKASVS